MAETFKNSIKHSSSNAVKFGPYGIILAKEQLMYYMDGELMRVKDVSNEFNSADLYRMAEKLAESKNAGPVYFTTPNKIRKYA
jgi:hypothetical protein